MFHKKVDLTLLKPESTNKDFAELCETAKKYSDIVRSICILPDPNIIKFCLDKLINSGIKISVVNDFPLGRGGKEIKYHQAILAKKCGAEEIDTVINIGALKEKNYKLVLEELIPLTRILPTKVIIETGYKWYNEKLIKKVAKLVKKSGAFCIKTSTGFIENIPIKEKILHVKWIYKAVPDILIKVAGGIKTKSDAQQFFDVVPSDNLIFGASRKFWLAE